MASILKINELQGNTTVGDITITGEGGSGTMQLQQGLVKSYCTIDAYQTTTGTTSSFNVSSVTDDGAGLWDTAYTNNMNTALYSVGMMGTGGSDNDANVRVVHVRTSIHTDDDPTTMLTSKCGFVYRFVNTSSLNEYGYAFSSQQVFGDLA